VAAILILFALAQTLSAAEYLWPLPSSQYLTGGFADSRPEHFHGGVDLRAQSPQPVIAPTDGWIERIAVTPTGYGRTLYFRLSDGKTAVYGHLSKFQPSLEAMLRDSQIVKGTSRVDFSFGDSISAPRFLAGETLAHTGSTGRGPSHFHFEIRDGAVQLDPLQFYEPVDKQAPVIVSLHKIESRDFTPWSSGTSVAIGSTIHSDNAVAFLIQCYDPGPWGRNAVPSAIRVRKGDELLYEVFPARIDLLGEKDIYEQLVWKDVAQHDKDTRRLFDHTHTGWIADYEGDVVIEVEDRAGNSKRATIAVSVGPRDFEARNESRLTAGAYRLEGECDELKWATVSSSGGSLNIGPDYLAFGDDVKLVRDIAPHELRPGLYIYKESAKGRAPLWTAFTEDSTAVSTKILKCGSYGIAYDSTPPKLLVSSKNTRIHFSLTDAETSIDDGTIKCRVDDRVAIAEFEYEEDGGVIWTQEPLNVGEHSLFFSAANRAGVLKEWQLSVTVK
jgi:hypothetical protein